MYYPAYFLPAIEGGYAVFFADLPEAFTQGDNLEDAMFMAEDVLAITLEEYAKARKELPAPSSLESVEAQAAARMAEDHIDHSRKPLVQFFKAPCVDKTPARFNVSMPRAVLESIDAKAKALGMTRSGFLAAAAMAYEA